MTETYDETFIFEVRERVIGLRSTRMILLVRPLSHRTTSLHWSNKKSCHRPRAPRMQPWLHCSDKIQQGANAL